MLAEYPKHLAVRVNAETSTRLKTVAAQRGESVSEFVRKLIEDRLGD